MRNCAGTLALSIRPPRRRLPLLIASLLLTSLLLCIRVDDASARSAPGKLIAYRVLDAHAGGKVRAQNGVMLYIPTGVLKRDALVTITRMRNGTYDLHIAGPWTGRVAVTLPPHKHLSVILHRIGATWVPEGRRGQRTVWVSQLSLFSWATDKIRAAACLKKNLKEIAQCLIAKGVKKIESGVVKWIAEHVGVSDDCAAAIIATKGWVLSLYTALLSETCRGHAGLGDAEIGAGRFPPGQSTPQPATQPQPQPQPTPQPQPATQPQPQPTTYPETTGGATNTWTNYTNAGGAQGPTIPAYTTVRIHCKVTGFRVADGNTWWYRIASSPWNDVYYASADAFYNNGQTSGSLHGTPFVDGNVPNC